jgi:hypothetical protein
MITKYDVMDMLVEACPSFKDKWSLYVSGPDYDEDLLFISLGEFTQHVVSLMKNNETNEFQKVFKVIENFLLNGDSYVKEATITGLLEGVQNVSYDHFDPEKFVPFLLPETKKWWQKLNDFWDGKGSLANDIEGLNS